MMKIINQKFNDDWEYVDCDCCQGKNAKKICAKDNLTYVRCINCGLIYLNPRPKDTSIIYTADYFLNSDVCKGYKVNYEDDFDKNSRHLFQFHLANINKLHPRKGRFVDIGCATGNFLEMVREDGWEPFGVEISEYGTDRVRNKIGPEKIFQGSLEDANFPGGYFEIVFASEIIEHVHRPKAFLLEIRRIVKPDGLVVITTPNGSSVFRKIMKDGWFHYRLEHLYLFPLSTLEYLMEKTGLNIIRRDFKVYMALLQFLHIDLESPARLLRTDQYAKGASLKAKLLSFSKSVFRSSLGRYLSDSIWIYAQPNKAEI